MTFIVDMPLHEKDSIYLTDGSGTGYLQDNLNGRVLIRVNPVRFIQYYLSPVIQPFTGSIRRPLVITYLRQRGWALWPIMDTGAPSVYDLMLTEMAPATIDNRIDMRRVFSPLKEFTEQVLETGRIERNSTTVVIDEEKHLDLIILEPINKTRGNERIIEPYSTDCFATAVVLNRKKLPDSIIRYNNYENTSFGLLFVPVVLARRYDTYYAGIWAFNLMALMPMSSS